MVHIKQKGTESVKHGCLLEFDKFLNSNIYKEIFLGMFFLGYDVLEVS